jgi:hypothetical protein
VQATPLKIAETAFNVVEIIAQQTLQVMHSTRHIHSILKCTAHDRTTQMHSTAARGTENTVQHHTKRTTIAGHSIRTAQI